MQPLVLLLESCYGVGMTKHRVLTNTPTARLIARDGSAWVTGNVRLAGVLYDVQALMFDEPSTYGIGGTDAEDAGLELPESARISKLWLREATSSAVVLDYDRGDLSINLLDPNLVAEVIEILTGDEVTA